MQGQLAAKSWLFIYVFNIMQQLGFHFIWRKKGQIEQLTENKLST